MSKQLDSYVKEYGLGKHGYFSDFLHKLIAFYEEHKEGVKEWIV